MGPIGAFFAAVPPEVYPAAGLGIVTAGLAWLRWISNTQSKTLTDLITTTTERLDEVTTENRGLRVAQRWCDHRLAESLRAVQLRVPDLVLPSEFYQDDPPTGNWPRIPPPGSEAKRV